MEQSYAMQHGDSVGDAASSFEAVDPGASRRVSRGIMQALEQGRLRPGQRLVETSLAAEYRVGRNAVREAVQWLSALSIVEVSRHRSAAIRQLDAAETLDVLEVAEAIAGLMAKAAARNFHLALHGKALEAALLPLAEARDAAAFARARRHFYRALLGIGGNWQLQRLFRASGLYIIFAQYPAAMPQARCLAEADAIAAAIRDGAIEHAQARGRAHIGKLRSAILDRDGH